MYVIQTSKKIQKDSTNVPDVVGFSNMAFLSVITKEAMEDFLVTIYLKQF